MRELRKKNEQIFPIIRIQKVFRGWKLRQKYKKAHDLQRKKSEVLNRYFQEWKLHVRRQVKLEKVIEKEHLLREGREGRMQEICYKMIKWGQRAK